MSYFDPSFIKRAKKSQSANIISPSSITLYEPVVADGEVVFAGEDPNIDIVMSPYSVIEFTLTPG